MSDLFKGAKTIHDGLKSAENYRRRVVSKKCDWKKGEDRALLESIERADANRKLLPQDGCCPNCLLYNEGRWNYQPVMCWGCFLAGGGEPGKLSSVQYKVTTAGIVVVEGVDIEAARLLRSWSRQTLARWVGVSKAYIQAIERQRERPTPELMAKIHGALSGSMTKPVE